MFLVNLVSSISLHVYIHFKINGARHFAGVYLSHTMGPSEGRTEDAREKAGYHRGALASINEKWQRRGWIN